jgi:cytochrome c-type biogenesis protein CcmH
MTGAFAHAGALRRLVMGLAIALALGLGAVAPGPALAVLPDEILDDPVLEARAREISKELRCLVCRNESIDESNADLARDMRILVRDRLLTGDSDEDVIAFIVARYGEYVLLRPQTDGVNMILWIAAPAMFVLALGTAFVYVRRRRVTSEGLPKGLSEAEQARLKELMGD